MNKKSKKQPQIINHTPSKLVYIGNPRFEKGKLTLIHYDDKTTEEVQINDISQFKRLIKPKGVNWVQVEGIHDKNIMSELGQGLNIHPLVLEDIMNTTERPKLEFHGDYLLLSLKKIVFDERLLTLKSEQISLILTKNQVFSFHEHSGHIIDKIKEGILSNQSKLRKSKSDYLFYTLLDAIVDDYFIAMEKIGNTLDDLEEKINDNPTQDTLVEIQTNKRQLIALRKAVFPLRESIHKLIRNESKLINKKTLQYFSDVYDHSIQIIETVESYRDINSGLKDMFLSSLSHRTNQVIYVLTIISTIFIPLTFISGVYGMNFKHIPELNWEHGYLVFWLIVIGVAGGLIIFFKKKKWM